MEIKSSFLGKHAVDPSTIISFPHGIPGFEDQTRFKLFHQEGDKPLIFWLQSLDDESLLFSVAQPSNFFINYNFVLSDAEEDMLQITNTADMLILIIVYKDESGQLTIKDTIKSPLIINSAKRLGMQKILAHIEQSITLTDLSNEINVSENT